MTGTISLSDDAMTMVMHFAQPLAPPDRVAFVNSLAQLLRQEPAQPPGDGAVNRCARALLASGAFKRSDAVAVGHDAYRHDRAKLRDGAAIG
jgi:hypothetical protein